MKTGGGDKDDDIDVGNEEYNITRQPTPPRVEGGAVTTKDKILLWGANGK